MRSFSFVMYMTDLMYNPRDAHFRSIRDAVDLGLSRHVPLVYFLKRVVVQELLNEVHVRHEHSPAAIPLEIQRIKGIAGEDRR